MFQGLDASGSPCEALIKFLPGQDTDSDTTLPLQRRVPGRCRPRVDLWLPALVNVGTAADGCRSWEALPPTLGDFFIFF